MPIPRPRPVRVMSQRSDVNLLWKELERCVRLLGFEVEGHVDNTNVHVTAPTTQRLFAADTIDSSGSMAEVAGAGTSVTLSSNPQVAPGEAGNRLTIVGTSSTNTVQIVSGNGVRLSLSGTVTLGEGDVLDLIYSDTIGAWLETSRSDN